MIKNLVFDFGKVLVDYDFELFFRQHIPDERRRWDFYALLNNENMQDIIDRELVPFDVSVDALVARHPDYARELSLFRDRYPELVTEEVPGMRSLLVRLREAGFALYGLTNWCSRVHETIRQFPIFELLDGWVISSEEHLIKPEAAIYQCLLQRFGLKPEECLFTDDRPCNVEGAQAVGLQALLFHDAPQYEQELLALLGVNSLHQYRIQ